MEMSALRALRLEEPLDFSEGDHGLSGGIQVPWALAVFYREI